MKTTTHLLGLLSLLTGATPLARAQAPVLTTRLPAANAVLAPRTGSVQLTFSQPMSAAAARPDAIRMRSSWRGSLAGTYSGGSSSTISFQPTRPLFSGEAVRVDVTARATSAAGVAATPSAYRFLAGVTPSAAFFPMPQEIPVQEQPVDLTVADLNNDGKQDFLVAGRSDGIVSVRLGTGAGGFTAAPDVAVADTPEQILLADLNADNKLDLITVHSLDNYLEVRLGNGLGGFTYLGRINAGARPTSAALGDVNNDGRLDILVTNALNTTVSVRLGDGLGNFAGTYNQTMTQTPDNIAVADVDRDGNLDMVVSNYYNNSISVRLGDGTGYFYTAGATVLVGTRPIGLVLRDVTGDGILDALCPISGTVTGTYGVSIRRGNGNGQFLAGLPNVMTSAIARDPVLQDVNGDGLVDMLVPNISASTVSVRLGDGTGRFTGTLEVSTNDYPSSAGLIDVDGDGHLDLLTANQGITNAYGNTVSVRYGNGRGYFDGPLNVNTGAYPMRSAMGDVNNDGILDLVTANGPSSSGSSPGTVPGTVSVRLGTGTGSFTDLPDITIAASPRDIALGDVNNDGNLDVLTAHLNSSTVGLRLGDGTGAFAATAITTNAGIQPTSITLGDVNHDGNLDLFGSNYGSNVVAVRLGDGAGSFTGTTNLATGSLTGPYGVQVDDMNEDGHPDLVVITSNVTTGGLVVCLGNGTGSFTVQPVVPGGASPSSLDVGDVNHDGHLDVVIGNFQYSGATVRLGNGQGGFTGSFSIPLTDTPSDLKLGDLNGDGNLDIVAGLFQRRQLRVVLGDGTGNFATATGQTLKVGLYPDGIQLADVDGDGDLDILSTCERADYVAVRFNGAISALLLATRAPAAVRPAFTAYPNPTTDGLLTLDLAAFATTPLELSVYNTLGQQVQHLRMAYPSATYGLALPAGLPTGTYLLRLRTTDGRTASTRLVKQ
jgi:hypothetical protein